MHYFQKYFLTFATLCAVALAGCGKEEPAQQEILRPVRYQQVYSSGGDRIRTFSGTARAGVESRLSFKVSGTVQQVAVQVGERINSGELIARLDPTDYQLQVQRAEASLDQAKAQALQSQQNYERIRQLYENRNASRNDLDASRAASESAAAQVAAAEKQLELANRQLAYTRLTAPTAGAIATVDIEPNENVQAGQTIAQMTAGSSLEVEVAMPEILISNVREGDAVQVSFDALPGVTCDATVVEVGVAASGLATTFPVTVRLNERQEGALPGMAAEVAFRFYSTSKSEAFLVPSFGVGEDRLGRFVFVLDFSTDEDDVAIVRRRAVTIGELTANGIEILEGLTEGDYLVTAGVSRIIDGQKVKFEATR